MSKNQWSGPRNIPLSSIKGAVNDSDVRNRSKRKGGHYNKPIHVKRSGGGYRIHDGNARVMAARRAGKRSIKAHVATGTAASSGCLLNTMLIMATPTALVALAVKGVRR